MHYVHLNNDNLIINLQGKVYRINKFTFHFKKILELLENPEEEHTIKALLEDNDFDPKQGKIELYLCPDDTLFYVTRVMDKEPTIKFTQTHEKDNILSFEEIRHYTDNAVFLGVYKTVDDIVDEWPEYFV